MVNRLGVQYKIFRLITAALPAATLSADFAIKDFVYSGRQKAVLILMVSYCAYRLQVVVQSWQNLIASRVICRLAAYYESEKILTKVR